jgi:ligand-binding SRPBCC domain-containing protein
MPLIELETFIKAPQQIVFDLSRSVDLHKSSMLKHKEEVIDGVSSGLMNKGDTVTWQARHLFRNRKLKVKITEMQSPDFFADEMLEGDFKKMRHEHYFRKESNGTLMIDKFCFELPFGIVGNMIGMAYLTSYMRSLLIKRNVEIKKVAEAGINF